MIDAVPQKFADFVSQLELKVAGLDDMDAQVSITSELLCDILANVGALDRSCTQTKKDHYARYHVYSDPQDRFCIVAMVWAPGQGTGVHDHGGCWCVEGVYQGQMRITRYYLEGNEGIHYRFRKGEIMHAGVGAVGNLIPPSEYHVMENEGTVDAVSVHVYGHELKSCRRFLPVNDQGLYEAREVPLAYDGEYV